MGSEYPVRDVLATMDTKVEVAAEALIQLKKKRPDSEEAMRKIRKVEPRLISYDLTSKFNDLFQPDPARVYGNGREPVPLLQEAVSGSFCLTIPVLTLLAHIGP